MSENTKNSIIPDTMDEDFDLEDLGTPPTDEEFNATVAAFKEKEHK